MFIATSGAKIAHCTFKHFSRLFTVYLQHSQGAFCVCACVMVHILTLESSDIKTGSTTPLPNQTNPLLGPLLGVEWNIKKGLQHYPPSQTHTHTNTEIAHWSLFHMLSNLSQQQSPILLWKNSLSISLISHTHTFDYLLMRIMLTECNVV